VHLVAIRLLTNSAQVLTVSISRLLGIDTTILTSFCRFILCLLMVQCKLPSVIFVKEFPCSLHLYLTTNQYSFLTYFKTEFQQHFLSVENAKRPICLLVDGTGENVLIALCYVQVLY